MYSIGIDLGGTNTVAGIVGPEGQIIYKESQRTRKELPFPDFVRNLADFALSAAAHSEIRDEEIRCIGIGMPSCINPKMGLTVNANNLGWRNVPFRSEFERYVHYPVYIGNDADCAALGEVTGGAGRGFDDVLMITIGTGIGGGMIVGGRIFSGADHCGGEFGHMKLVYDGIPCSCGQRGCFESYASATALIRETKEAAYRHSESRIWEVCGQNLSNVEGRTVFDAADMGDETARKVLEQYISYLAAGLSSIICVFRPSMIILGGGISGAKDQYLLDPLRKKLAESTFAGEEIGVPPVRKAELGNDAGLLGAAMLWKNRG